MFFTLRWQHSLGARWCLCAAASGALLLAQSQPVVTTVPPLVRNGVTVKVINAPSASQQEKAVSLGAGQKAHVDPQTGRLRDPEHDESRKLSDELTALFNVPVNLLQPVKHANGMVSVDLEGAFMQAATAKIGPDGKVTLSCDPATAAHKAKTGKEDRNDR